MSLDPFFSLSPRKPIHQGYDAANPSDPYVNAYFFTYGGKTGPGPYDSLQSQYDNDRVLLAFDPVLDSDRQISSPEDFRRRSSVWVKIAGQNMGAARDYLLVFRLKKRSGSPIAQFFVGNAYQSSEPIALPTYDDVPLQIEAPSGNSMLYIVVRLAASNSAYNNSFFFEGVDGYLI